MTQRFWIITRPPPHSLFLSARIFVGLIEAHRVPDIVPGAVCVIGLRAGDHLHHVPAVLARLDALDIHADGVGIARTARRVSPFADIRRTRCAPRDVLHAHMDLTDVDRDRAGRARLFADKISAEAIVLLDAGFDQLAKPRKSGELRGIARGRCSRGRRSGEGSRDERGDDHSTFRLSLRISTPHFASSLSMSAAYSSGVEVSGSPPSEWMRCFISSVPTSLRSSALILSTIGRGIPAGPSTP